jgi:hypothetical protein
MIRTPLLPIVLRPTITTRRAILHLNIRTDTHTLTGTVTDIHGQRTRRPTTDADIKGLRTLVIMGTGVKDPGNSGFLWRSGAGLDGQTGAGGPDNARPGEKGAALMVTHRGLGGLPKHPILFMLL